MSKAFRGAAYPLESDFDTYDEYMHAVKLYEEAEALAELDDDDRRGNNDD